MHKHSANNLIAEVKKMNQSKMEDQRFWRRWRQSGAVGSLETAQRRKKMTAAIKAINNARGVEIIRDGLSIRFIGRFSSGDSSEMALTLSEAENLLNTGLFKIPGVYGKALIEQKMVRIWFKPSGSSADLVCLRTRDFVSKLRLII